MPASVPLDSPVAVARKMAAEDARWALDSLLSAGQARQGVIPLLLIGHAGRIVYEGSDLARSATKAVADPVLAARLPLDHADAIAKARHAAKLFDDDLRPYNVLLAHMDAYLRQARSEFLGNTPYKWARRFEGDLGMYWRKRRVLGITPTVSYRMGEPPGTSSDDLAAKVLAVARTYGRALAVLAESAGQPYAPNAAISFQDVGYLSSRDRRSDKYLSGRFDPSYPESLKLVLLHVEGELNTLREVFPATASGHEEAVFRATVVGAFHGVSALEHAEKNRPAPPSQHADRMRELLCSPERQRLFSAHGRLVRNRCMHYEIKSKLTGPLHPALPMNGIIEALRDGRPHADYLADLTAVLTETSDLLHGWNA